MTLTTQDTARFLDLKKRVENLSPGDQLRLCAELIDKGDAGSLAIAETLTGRVVDELRLVRMLAKGRK